MSFMNDPNQRLIIIFFAFSPSGRSQSPEDLPHPSILNRVEPSSGMFDASSMQMDGFRDKSGGYHGLGKKKGK